MLRNLAVLFLAPTLFVNSTLVSAQAADAQTAISLPAHIRSGTLPNGLRYAVGRVEASKGEVYMRLIVKAGENDEEKDHPQVYHLLEHMLFGYYTGPGGQRFPIVEKLREEGLVWGDAAAADGHADQTNYHYQVPATLWKPYLRFLRGTASGTVLLDSELQMEKSLVIEELGNSDSEDLVSIIGNRRGSLSHRGKTQEEIFASIRRESLDSLEAYYRRWYTPGNQTLYVLGDIDEVEAEQLVKSLFSDIPAGPKDMRPVGARPDDFALPADLALIRGGRRTVEAGVTIDLARRDNAGIHSELGRVLFGRILLERFEQDRRRLAVPYRQLLLRPKPFDLGPDTISVTFEALPGNMDKAMGDISSLVRRQVSPEELAAAKKDYLRRIEKEEDLSRIRRPYRAAERVLNELVGGEAKGAFGERRSALATRAELAEISLDDVGLILPTLQPENVKLALLGSKEYLGASSAAQVGTSQRLRETFANGMTSTARTTAGPRTWPKLSASRGEAGQTIVKPLDAKVSQLRLANGIELIVAPGIAGQNELEIYAPSRIGALDGNSAARYSAASRIIELSGYAGADGYQVGDALHREGIRREWTRSFTDGSGITFRSATATPDKLFEAAARQLSQFRVLPGAVSEVDDDRIFAGRGREGVASWILGAQLVKDKEGFLSAMVKAQPTTAAQARSIWQIQFGRPDRFVILVRSPSDVETIKRSAERFLGSVEFKQPFPKPGSDRVRAIAGLTRFKIVPEDVSTLSRVTVSFDTGLAANAMTSGQWDELTKQWSAKIVHFLRETGISYGPTGSLSTAGGKWTVDASFNCKEADVENGIAYVNQALSSWIEELSRNPAALDGAKSESVADPERYSVFYLKGKYVAPLRAFGESPSMTVAQWQKALMDAQNAGYSALSLDPVADAAPTEIH